MMDPNAEDAVEIRRIQNRMAQRRFRRRKQTQRKAVDWDEGQEDGYDSVCLDVQSQELSPRGTSFPTELYSSSSVNSTGPGLGSLAASFSENFFVDDTSFLEHSTAASAQNHRSSLPTSPASSAAIEQTPSSSSSDQIIAHPGSNTSLGRALHNLGPKPTSDIASSSSRNSAGGWLSPLHIAAQKGHDRIARILLQHNTDCNEKDSDGLTPIIHAVMGGHEDVVRSLLLHGARIGNIDGEQQLTALHWAVLYRRETPLRVLLNHCFEKRTSIDGYDDLGRTPLHIAIDTGFETGVLMLLQFGANPQYRARKA